MPVKIVLTIAPLLLAFVAGVAASTFVVNNTIDPGDGVCDDAGCTLREAIEAANAHFGADAIIFFVSGTGLKTITPTSPLPTITEAVTIDGYTQTGATENTLSVGDNAALMIELDGSLAGLLTIGLDIAADDCIIRGLLINRFGNSGININGNANTIEGNFVGTDVTGTDNLGNGFRGISITTGDNNLIGGSLPTARNLISGNGSAGVVIFCCGADANSVVGNYIGTDHNGTAALPNDEGVSVSGDASSNIVGGNVISGNATNGVHISGEGSLNVVWGNFIGMNATGTGALPNGNDGVLVDGQVYTFIGGDTSSTLGNLISGNGQNAIEIVGNATHTTVQGNYIGTDVSGTFAVPNAQNGILISSAMDSQIGGTTAEARNVIAGNGFGIQVTGPAAGTLIQGNYIGTDASGTGPLMNFNQGIILPGSGVTVGGEGGAGNVIAFNFFSGIKVMPTGSGNTFFGNSIFGNGALGIDLAGGIEDDNSVTQNDPGDTDTGANDLQNYPALVVALASGGDRTAEGLFTGGANTDYVLHFYSNREVDPSGFGEGETYLGALDLHTDTEGIAEFSFTLDPSTARQFITVTATDPNGNTSEFSPASNPVPAPQFLNISTRLAVGTGDNVLIGGFILTGTEAKPVMLRGIGPSLGAIGVPGFLADPTIELHKPDGTVVTNNNWRDTQEQEIIDTGIPPTDDLEAAIVATLDPGAYTCVLRGTNAATGVGLVEAYELVDYTASELANISTRGLVQTGDNVMIGGFIIGRIEENSSVILRAIGPSLTALGVAGALQDPVLELHDENGAIIKSNDNWMDSPDQQAIIDHGLAPTEEKESALLAMLSSGAYTAIVRGVGGTTGVSLVEAYHLD